MSCYMLTVTYLQLHRMWDDKTLKFLILLGSTSFSTHEEFCFLEYDAAKSGK